jgi:hypothetical protein
MFELPVFCQILLPSGAGAEYAKKWIFWQAKGCFYDDQEHVRGDCRGSFRLAGD